MSDVDPALIALAEYLAAKRSEEVWRDDAACLGMGTVTFFPDPGSDRLAEEAKAVCAGCPVRSNCLRMAVDEDLRAGIFGGLTFAERKAAGLQPARKVYADVVDRATRLRVGREYFDDAPADDFRNLYHPDD